MFMMFLESKIFMNDTEKQCENKTIQPDEYYLRAQRLSDHSVSDLIRLQIADCMMFFRVISGSLQIQVQTTLYPLVTGDLVVVSPRHIFRLLPGGDEFQVDIIWLNLRLFENSLDNSFQESFLQPLQAGDVDFDVPFGLETEGFADMERIFASAFRLVYLSQNHWFSLGASLMLLLAGMACANGQAGAEDAVDDSDAFKLERFISISDYLEENYARNISLEAIGDIAGLNEQYLCRFFKDFCGLSPIQYLIALRLEKARQMLVHSDRSIQEISFACGFGSVSYFIRKFKEAFGVTPKKYQQHHTLQAP